MSLPHFQFKKFSIYHDKCAMKVNTDGILLGAWTDITAKQHILDIGTGTGIISLMAAQRSEVNCKITALELDPEAASQAKDNVLRSPWQDQINVIQGDFLNWASDQQYDLLISNPPYFSDSLKNPDHKKASARHNHDLTFEKLLNKAQRIATSNATFCLIIPFNEGERFGQALHTSQWHIRRLTAVKHNQNKATFRWLLELSNDTSPHPVKTVNDPQQTLNIRDLPGDYSKEFTALCRDFYLKM